MNEEDEELLAHLTADGELLPLLGEMVITAVALESVIVKLLQHFLSRPGGSMQPENVLKQGVTGLMNTCRDEVNELPVAPRRVHRLGEILDDCKGAFEERNQYVHGAWMLDGPKDEGTPPTLFTLRRRQKDGVTIDEDVFTDDLRTLVATFRRLKTELRQWAVNMYSYE
ncbi:hypothetical protein ACFVRB_11355 [Streptomyces nojiriensis]|uniref:hypothetical protein n=1 Tax=Streptomyces nojiriensis TaxID=66374 RepID=UPI0036DD9560